MTLGSSTNRVLHTPELLGGIFSVMDKSCNAANASVCKQWHGFALDALWRDVNDVHPLLSNLAPLKRNGKDYHFARLPEPDDWKRFHAFSRRVRTLSFQETSIGYGAVFDDVARTRTTLNILPNLRTLEWTSMSVQSVARYSIIFMHEFVTRFMVAVAPMATERFPESYFRDVARMPMLTVLDLGIYVPAPHVEDALVDLIANLPRLESIILPKYHLTSKVVAQLSTLEWLERIYVHHRTTGADHSEDATTFSPQISQGAFPRLWELSLTARLEHIRPFLPSFSPINVTDIHIESLEWQSPSSVHEFLLALRESCPNLRLLCLRLLDEYGLTRADPSRAEIEQSINTTKQITLETLRPLLTVSNLVSFEISHVYPLRLTASDIEVIATAWPLIQNLILNCAPIVTPEPSLLTPSSLLPFAQHCPHLERLGIFMNAAVIGVSSSTPLQPFKALSLLCAGVSHIRDKESVALFLSGILPLHCQVECGILWSPEFAEEGLRKELERRFDVWTEVERLVPLLTETRLQERQIMLKKHVKAMRGLLISGLTEMDEGDDET